VCLEFTVFDIYFYHSGILSNFKLALKNRVALKFFTVLKYFSSFRIFEQVALALKTKFTLKFFKPVGLPTPDSYAYGLCNDMRLLNNYEEAILLNQNNKDNLCALCKIAKQQLDR